MTRVFPLLLVLVAGVCHAQGIRVLFLGDQGPHQPRARFDELQPALTDHGINSTYTEDIGDLTLENLRRFHVLVVYANIDTIDRKPAEAILEFVDGGGGFVPLHCASYCFRNQPDLVALIGAQFQRHGTGEFQAEIARSDHELMRGFGGFRSWDETYVHHLHNADGRTVLAYRIDEEGREPWTWIRTHGKGRVFYTASGHDARTWTNPGFQNLVERGIRWAAKHDPAEVGDYMQEKPFPVPKTKELAADRQPLEYLDVGGNIPNYTPSKTWGVQGKPISRMQKPLAPDASLKHLVVPEGFHVELFAAEPDLQGKPICMSWDERGRLWVAETYDYPNEFQPPGGGRDRIRICEDTNGDGRADTFTLFADGLSIPTSIAFHRGGVIVQNGTETLYLRDTDGDDQADERRVLIRHWELRDTHGGVSNFQYGLDNWIWAMQGYNNSSPEIDGKPQQRFRMGFFRMRPDGSEIEFIRSTNNNTWGLGISEEGLVFGSTANGNPSIYMPIPNRYYERVRGWAPSLTLSSIADSNQFSPITDKVRQVDHHGGYTAGAGHALYTARKYPQEYWNRVAFVNGPTGHLVGAFVLRRTGSDFRSTNTFNLLASDDEWTAPIMAEVGPDGHVWVIDWYNYIVQHNPTPEGFTTGKGQAYETDLRDKKHGRIYRVVADPTDTALKLGEHSTQAESDFPDLSIATPGQLVEALTHPTMLIRKHAQRLLVERGDQGVAEQLVRLVDDKSIDAIGLNVGAIHALWTLQGLGMLDGQHARAQQAVRQALRHPSAGVRRNAVAVLPPTAASVEAMVNAELPRDPDAIVRLAATLAMSDLPPHDTSANALTKMLSDPSNFSDRWLPDAITSAAAHNSAALLRKLAAVDSLHQDALPVVARIAEHHMRGEKASDVAEIVAILADADPQVIGAVVNGLDRGWKPDRQVTVTAQTEQRMARALDRVDAGIGSTLVKLAVAWGSDDFRRHAEGISLRLLRQARDETASDADRIEAAQQLIAFSPTDKGVAIDVLDEVTPRVSPQLAIGLLAAVETSRADGIGAEIVGRLKTMSPARRESALALILQSEASTEALLQAVREGRLSLNDLALDQRQLLAMHPNEKIRNDAKTLFVRDGELPSTDREKILQQYMETAGRKGDAAQGKKVFKQQCSKCHVHGELGIEIGPNLTGMAVHPKRELLTQILDPSRNVEGNFRAYSVETAQGRVLNGMLASESKTAVELIDTEGNRTSVLREDIDEMFISDKSIMPEGFEKLVTPDEMADLLEFLTTPGKYTPLPLAKVATAISTRPLFSDSKNGPDRMVFANWGPKTFHGVPFQLTNPNDGTRTNIVLLHGPLGILPPKMPRSVSLPCNASIKSLHLLSGVGGWNYPYRRDPTVSMIVRFHYADGQIEDHPLRNGIHFADYIRRVDVPKSEFAFSLGAQQIRYLSVDAGRSDPIESIELAKGDDDTSPIVMAVTIEHVANE